MKISSTKNISQKTGLPPGSLVHVGNHMHGHTDIEIIQFNEDSLVEIIPKSADECFKHLSPDTLTWIRVTGLGEIDKIEKIGSDFGIHPLLLEDILNTSHRISIEDFESYICTIFKTLSYDEPAGHIERDQVSLIFGESFVISFQEKPDNIFDPIIDHIRNPKSRLRKMKSDYLFYSLMDMVVDNYFVLVEKLGDMLEVLEEEIIENPGYATINKLHLMKREMIHLRKAVWPFREVLNRLQRSDSELIYDTTLMYFKDVYDHIIQVLDTIESFRDILSGMVDIYISISGNKMNEIMKVLTIMSTIFIPLTFLAGVYGMNFKYMPELELPWFYPWFFYGMLAAIALSMLAFFKKKKWI
ncbi:MAG: magnesium/cobalt transporter CorA [Peptoclostridium sp.]|uniref:magnesium/cobalt transporter CorA n=1 Tax=Peptoclostridium sp. TaxID=1904860 RepID=UPI00139AEA25|nr:magnesium/cobalt transporter CorA [Peptoclostridium sp.]MZQ76462.1 magnesium/cobalt transporter CorA [Peptoclostridium sp.]